MAIETIVEKLIAPQIEKFVHWCKGKYNYNMIPKAEYFEGYLVRAYEKYSIINTLVFHNSQRRLKDIYVVQTLKKENSFEGKEEINRIDGMPVELIKRYKKILITDTAGMGKSTIMKRLFIDVIDRGMVDIGIPIYIELNRLNRDNTILQEIQEKLNVISFDRDLLLKFFQAGGFIFFLDGYDEISIDDINEVSKDIQCFISKASMGNYFIITSRPESGLSSFGDFQSFKIKPFVKEDAFELIRKYDLSKNKELSGKLVKLLKSGKYDAINEYLGNPLLVSLLYSAFDHKQTIPLKKHIFYRQVYDAYFDAHDLTKGTDAHQKRSGLDIDDFNRVLKYIGYESLVRIGVQYNKDTILNSIQRAKEFCGNLDFHSNDFLKDLVTAVPLFIADGTEYKWAHISLMEYFAARFIAEDAKMYQDKILTAVYKSEKLEKYINMLDIYYDIDYKGFSKNITFPLCEHLITLYNDSSIPSNICNNSVEQRLSYLLYGETAFLISSKDLSYANVCHLFNHEELDSVFVWYKRSIKDENLYVFLSRKNNLNNIVRLLFRKNSSIITDMKEFSVEANRQLEENGLSESSFERDKVYIIDLKTGDQNEETYRSVNMMMSCYFSLQLDYVACKNVVANIKRDEKEQDDSMSQLFII